ncbi:unnamed protein product [Ambrosiozyma monospora]|uniref:Unnamed protein product n=1 Tax=Ambrosiozyma monospora TaxID=43982 RepID=A0ACB5UCD0_AMBMO|nr:unnamed protein product [Ambrosiozyma monospora]
MDVYLDPLARVSSDKQNNLVFTNKSIQADAKFVTKSAQETASVLTKLAKSADGSSKGVGVDVELISAINVNNTTFIERNFTANEIAYCSKAPSPVSSFAGTWSAKEAVFKSLEVESKGAGASLKDIEILRDSNER